MERLLLPIYTLISTLGLEETLYSLKDFCAAKGPESPIMLLSM